MNIFDGNTQLLLGLLAGGSEENTLAYVLEGMAEILGDDAPDAKAVESYLRDPDSDTQLNSREQFLVIDKLLEYTEVNLRTICDMVRYKFMKDAGMVQSVDEFLALFRSDDEE